MRIIRTTLVSLTVMSIMASLSACGGGGGASSPGGGAITTNNAAPGASGEWQEMKIEGATVRFEMPKPIKMNEDAKEGVVVYASQNAKEKMSFKVGMQKRNYQEDQAKGQTDDQVLTTYATRVLKASQEQFAQMGLKTQFQPHGSAKLPTGIAQEYVGTVGKATVVNRFYINNQGLYFVEATTQNIENPDFVRFLNSFTP
ncbi:MAG: hypothetical protein K8F91_02430 [Candidatus Obscuribacterales bacterium]|nr:hypothetical protein [Candidatus Obscuribacterales bacterium]